MLVRVAPWGAPGSALKKAVRVRLAVSTMALHGDTRYAPGAGVIRRATRRLVCLMAFAFSVTLKHHSLHGLARRRARAQCRMLMLYRGWSSRTHSPEVSVAGRAGRELAVAENLFRVDLSPKEQRDRIWKAASRLAPQTATFCATF